MVISRSPYMTSVFEASHLRLVATILQHNDIKSRYIVVTAEVVNTVTNELGIEPCSQHRIEISVGRSSHGSTTSSHEFELQTMPTRNKASFHTAKLPTFFGAVVPIP